jgi:Protein of unknown function (DUF1236)
MQVVPLRNTTFALALLGSTTMFGAGAAWAQAPGSPGGTVASPNAIQPRAPASTPTGGVQPVPGAMPGSDTVPSAMSAKNAADDKLPIAAYTFKELTGDQRRAIYQTITRKTLNAAPPSAASAAEFGSELPTSVALSAIPGEMTAQIPQTTGYEYAMVGDKLLLVSPVNRVIVGIIAP